MPVSFFFPPNLPSFWSFFWRKSNYSRESDETGVEEELEIDSEGGKGGDSEDNTLGVGSG